MLEYAEETFGEGILLEKGAEFEKAKAIYDEELLRHVTDDALLGKIRIRMEDIDDLIAEKAIYRRMDENEKRVLTEIGINVIESQPIMNLLMEADAVYFDNETALFIPLKRDYIDQCLKQVPRKMPGDPGMNSFGTGATSPFLAQATTFFLTVFPIKRSSMLPWHGSIPGLQIFHPRRPEAVPVCPM